MQAYEFVRVTEDGFEGQTFGCSCCSSRKRVENPLHALYDTARMYRRMAETYAQMYMAVSHYGQDRVVETCLKVRYIEAAKYNLDACRRHLAGESAGKHGAKMAQVGEATLKADLDAALRAMDGDDANIAADFGWEW
jgi:hypothetical protein